VVNLIKLTNGVEILGRIINDSDKSIKVNNPLQVNYYLTKQSQTMPSVALQRYLPFSSEEDIEFKKEHIMNISIPIRGMDEYYSQILHNIKLNIDPNIVNDLLSAAETLAEGAQEEKDMYLAILERMSHKRPLN
jgi:GrpB-like predicted nucleotidyltransferase (UPF0157 family)